MQAQQPHLLFMVCVIIAGLPCGPSGAMAMWASTLLYQMALDRWMEDSLEA